MDQVVAEPTAGPDINRAPISGAPLWLPVHERVVVEQSAAQPPDAVSDYSLADIVKVALFGSRWKSVISVASVLLTVVFITAMPTLVGAGFGSAAKAVIYQAWTLGLMLIASARVRSLSVGALCRYYLVGVFTVAMVVYLATAPFGIADSAGAMVWLVGTLEELVKLLPVGAAIYFGRRFWRHPGLADLMLIGFAVGAGYGLHQSALWERTNASGFEPLTGLLVPSIHQPVGLFAAGHAVWTSLIAFAVGLVVFYRHQAFALVGAATLALVVIGDHLAITDDSGSLDVVRQLTFNGTLIGAAFVAVFVGAVALDRQRLAAISARDHLFPSDRAHSRTPDAAPEDDLLRPLLRTRYRRLRNAVHNTIDASPQQWPSPTRGSTPAVAELARRGRAAELAVGPGTASRGWAPDPTHADRFRFFSGDGFTEFTATGSSLEDEHTASLGDETEIDHETTVAGKVRRTDFWQFVGFGAIAVAIVVGLRLVTAGEPHDAVFAASSLVDAPQTPAVVRGLLGAVLAALTIRGRASEAYDEGWNVGPGDDPTPDRPHECEA